MTKVKGIMLTEKGVVKAPVRKGIVEKEIGGLEINGFERVENKAVLVKEYTDTKGNMVYATLTLTVSTNDPRVEKPKTKATKEKATETFEILE